MLDADKRYIASVKLGITTDTEDITGTVIEEKTVDITSEQLYEVLNEFKGIQMQRPPMYSALKKDGIPMYKLARKGETIDIPEREIEVYSLDLVKPLDREGNFTIECFVSKGTYIRSLVRDIGEKLGCGATLTELTRTFSAGIDIKDCVELSHLNAANVNSFILKEERAVSHLREVAVSENQAIRFSNGGELGFDRLRIKDLSDGELLRVKFRDLFLGIGYANCSKQHMGIKCIINYPKNKNAVALGTFDGVHIGHRKVLDLPDDCRKIAVCFSKPPKSVLGGTIELLCDNSKKTQVMKKIGIDEVYTLDFEEMKDKTAEEFLEFIKAQFNPKIISCGFNYRFGKGAKGDIELLRKFADENGIRLICANPVKRDGELVSSTGIRSLLKDGKIEKANSLMSESFSFTSTVISGDRRGRTIGFPTINQRYPESLVALKFGVYKSKVYFGGREYEGITNIGKRPTYPSDYIIAETFIKDFQGDLYGEKVTVCPISFLREEVKFGSLDELKKQIESDLQN
jgi:riboflavin kinase/FMN adenylyltransferase